MDTWQPRFHVICFGQTIRTYCKAHLHIPFTHAFTTLHCIFLLLTLVCWYLWIKKLLLPKRNAMRKTHVETRCGNSAVRTAWWPHKFSNSTRVTSFIDDPVNDCYFNKFDLIRARAKLYWTRGQSYQTFMRLFRRLTPLTWLS